MTNAMTIHRIFYILVTCGTNMQQAASGNVSDTLQTRANHAKLEALYFLDDRSKVLQTPATATFVLRF